MMCVRIGSVLSGISFPEYIFGSFIANLLFKIVIVCNIMSVLIMGVFLLDTSLREHITVEGCSWL
jgi:hypothetical protein